jgi:hypothetical protein
VHHFVNEHSNSLVLRQAEDEIGMVDEPSVAIVGTDRSATGTSRRAKVAKNALFASRPRTRAARAAVTARAAASSDPTGRVTEHLLLDEDREN